MTKTDRDVLDELAITRSNSLSGVLQRALEKLILSGELPPGSRLNELHLAARFGTSRGPLREAMRGVLARGLLEVFPNRGMFVRDIPTDEALDIYDLRAALFGLAGRRLAERITQQHLEHLDLQLSQMDAFAAEGDLANYYRLNLGFHQFLVTQAGNRMLEQEYVTLVNKLHLCRARGLVQAGSMLLSSDEHRAMVEALASADPGRAQDMFFAHVENARGRFQAALGADQPGPSG